METFLFALADEDFDTGESAMAADQFVWQNVGLSDACAAGAHHEPAAPRQGRFGFEVKFHRIAEDGATVLTERTDALIIGPLRLQFWVCGPSRCTTARSRCGVTISTSSTSLVKAPLRAVAAIGVPSLRPTF